MEKWTYFDVSVRYESICNFSDDAADDSGVEQGDVGDPEHSEDEGTHEDREVAAPGRRSQIAASIETRNVADVDTGELVLQNPGQVPDLFPEFGLQCSFNTHLEFFSDFFLDKITVFW